MGDRVKTGSALLVALVVGSAGAARADVFNTRSRSSGTFGDALQRPSYWLVGVTVDRAAGVQRLDDEDAVGDQLFGVDGTWRRAWFGLHTKLAITPQRRVRRSRTLLVFGPRASVRALGRAWSLGVNAQGEAVLDDHRWTLYLSPIELGGDLYARGSFHVQLFVGARYAVAGKLIENMFVDPNGFESQLFDERLDAVLDTPWEAYASLVFARSIE